VSSGRGLCEEMTTPPEESYRLLCVAVWFRNFIYEEPNINQLGLNLKGGYITGCISCMSLIGTVNTIAECPRTDCIILGGKRVFFLIFLPTNNVVVKNTGNSLIND
jgi:hypothetical protein